MKKLVSNHKKSLFYIAIVSDYGESSRLIAKSNFTIPKHTSIKFSRQRVRVSQILMATKNGQESLRSPAVTKMKRDAIGDC
jgi:hypothetical protein